MTWHKAYSRKNRPMKPQRREKHLEGSFDEREKDRPHIFQMSLNSATLSNVRYWLFKVEIPPTPPLRLLSIRFRCFFLPLLGSVSFLLLFVPLVSFAIHPFFLFFIFFFSPAKLDCVLECFMALFPNCVRAFEKRGVVGRGFLL